MSKNPETPYPSREGENLNEIERDKIAQAIISGSTSGTFANEGSDDEEFFIIVWALQTNKWEEN